PDLRASAKLSVALHSLPNRRPELMTPADSRQLLADVEAFCEEIRPIEELCYVEHRFNDQVIPLGRKYNLLGMPLPTAYGGRNADTVTYARALARINREGTGCRTFFSGHTSIGQYPILTWGNDEQKRRYLPASCQGDKILAFGLTEPEAGSNPLEMQSTYERRGDRFLLNGVKYLISNGGIATTVVAFAYPKGRTGRVSAFIVDTAGPTFVAEELTAKHQLVQEHLAAIEMARVATEAMVMKAAEAKDASNAEPSNADLKARADLLAAQAKLFAANAAFDAADRALQVYGGRGWSTLY